METKIVKVNSCALNGTSFFGQTIECSKNHLKEYFGNPNGDCSENENEKVQNEWSLKLTSENESIPFAIYDWKEYRKYNDDEDIHWHIGVPCRNDGEKVLKAISNLFKEEKTMSIADKAKEEITKMTKLIKEATTEVSSLALMLLNELTKDGEVIDVEEANIFYAETENSCWKLIEIQRNEYNELVARIAAYDKELFEVDYDNTEEILARDLGEERIIALAESVS